MKDLVVLVPDKNTQFAVRGILERHEALGIRPIAFDFRPHPGRDGGARTSGAELLARERPRFTHALLLFDFEGCGASASSTSSDLEYEQNQRLSQHWGDRARAIVIEPEVDAWVWGAESVMKDELNWPLQDGIRKWLAARGHEFTSSGKPIRPKEALEALLPIHQQPRSSALYEKLTRRISLSRCSDPAFGRLRETLRIWFSSTAV